MDTHLYPQLQKKSLNNSVSTRGFCVLEILTAQRIYSKARESECGIGATCGTRPDVCGISRSHTRVALELSEITLFSAASYSNTSKRKASSTQERRLRLRCIILLFVKWVTVNLRRNVRAWNGDLFKLGGSFSFFHYYYFKPNLKVRPVVSFMLKSLSIRKKF